MVVVKSTIPNSFCLHSDAIRHVTLAVMNRSIKHYSMLSVTCKLHVKLPPVFSSSMWLSLYVNTDSIYIPWFLWFDYYWGKCSIELVLLMQYVWLWWHGQDAMKTFYEVSWIELKKKKRRLFKNSAGIWCLSCQNGSSEASKISTDKLIIFANKGAQFH